MKKKFIQSTFILLIGGFITKFLGMFIKIIMTRQLGLEGISLYMLILPTFSLFMSLGQAGIPLSLSRMVASKKTSTSNLFGTTFFFLIIYNLLLVLFIIILSPTISTHLLHNTHATLPLIAVGCVIPFTTISSFCRSYYIGRERMFPTVFSNVIENMIRLLFMIFGLSFFSKSSYVTLVFITILFNIVSEGFSTFILLCFLPKRIHFNEFHIEKSILKDVLSLSIPNISGNIIGNITYFLEPILYTTTLLFLGSSKTTIMHQYGILTGYVFPLFFLPTFFTYAFVQSIFSYQTREVELHHIKQVKKVFNLELFCYFLFSIFMGVVFFFFGKQILLLLYHTTLGYSYLKILSFFSFFYYSQSIFSYLFLAMGKTKEIFYSSCFSSIIRILSLTIFLFLNMGIFSILFSFIMNIILLFLFQYIRIQKYFS